jgi:glucokinase
LRTLDEHGIRYRVGSRAGIMQALGIDFGGTKTALALVDGDGNLLARAERPSREDGRPLGWSAIGSWAREAVRAAGLAWSDLAGVGAIVPGVYDPRTGRAWAPNLWGQDEIELRDALGTQLEAPLTIDSDRCGYVIGECWRGAARGARDVVFVAVGTGIGAGILSGGRLVRGAGGVAGAVGWMATSPTWQSRYGELGCFEAEAAGPALARRAGAATGDAVVAAARSGDARARRAVAETVEALSLGIASLIGVLNPEVVVLGGGVMQAPDLFLEPIRAAVRRWAQPIALRQCRIEPTALGADAGVLGAARLAFPDSFTS